MPSAGSSLVLSPEPFSPEPAARTPPPPRPLDGLWPFVFGNEQPVCIEIGPGRGERLLRNAGTHPQQNFFGIERSRSHAAYVAAEIGRRRLSNARVVYGDAVCLLNLLPDASVDAYEVLFPDPWWKRRHQRRRVMSRPFIFDLRRTLVPGGTIYFVTDVRDYYLLTQHLLDAEIELEAVAAPAVIDTETSFARKAQSRGDPLYVSLHRRPSAEAVQGNQATVPDP